MSEIYYVRFFDAAGNPITGPNRATWFAIPAATFAFNQSGGLQIGPGNASFGPLSLSLGIDSIDGLLLTNLAAGQTIKEIEVAGYTTISGHSVLVDDYAFENATVTMLSVSNETDDGFTFGYLGYQATHYGRDSSGAVVGSPFAASWSLATHSDQLSFLPTLVASGVPAPHTINLSASPSLTYYVEFTPKQASALADDGGSNWIAITNPSFTLSVPTSGGVSFGALSVSLASSKVSEALQQAFVNSATFATIELASYDSSGQLVDDYTFGEAQGASVNVNATAGGTQSYSFNYKQVQDRQTTFNAEGQPSGTTVAGWDVDNGVPATNLHHAAPSAPPTETPPNAPSVYYVRMFDASDNPITGPSGSTWFAIPAARFALAQTASAGAGGAGGNVSLGPLSFSSGINSIDGALLSDLTSVSEIKEIEVAGFAKFGESTAPVLIDDYAFEVAFATTMSVGSDGVDEFSFAYGGYEAKHYVRDSNGAIVGSPAVATWGGKSAQLPNPSPTLLASNAPAPTTTNLTASPSLAYYVRCTPTSGSPIADDRGSNWIKITDPSFKLTVSTDGGVSFEALSLSLDSSNASEALQQDLMSGAFNTVELASYDSSGQLIDDYTFGEAQATNVSVGAAAGGTQSYSFHYYQFQDQQTTFDTSGRPSGTTIAGWDAQNQVADTSLAHTAPSTAPVDAAPIEASAYYVRLFDAAGNPVTGPDGSAWFAISAATFALAEEITHDSQAGGVASFGPLSLSLGIDSVDNALLSDLTSGAGIKEIEVAGFATPQSAAPTLVDDYAFENATVTKLSVSNDSSDGFTFGFTGYEARHYVIDSSGAVVGSPTVATWNAANNTNGLSFNPTLLASGATAPTTNNLSANPNLTYYIQFVPPSGSPLTDDGGSNWFQITNPFFTLSKPEGHALSFGPLTFSLSFSRPSVVLQQFLTSDSILQTIELASYDGSGQLVDDYTFGKAQAASDSVSADAAGTETYTIDYLQVQDRQTIFDAQHQPSGTTVAGWDAENNLADSSLSHTAPAIEPVCYCPGTRILTDRGEVAVEELATGDLVVTFDGRLVPVTWLGVQTVSTRGADPVRVLPIRIQAGALAEKVPSRDLRLSPDHAVLIGDALFQAGALVNGISIVREREAPESLTYYHVETPDHSLIFAENTPAETFIDNVDRLAFDNWAEHESLYPDGKEMRELPYPRAKSLRQVPMAVRALIAERAGAVGPAASMRPAPSPWPRAPATRSLPLGVRS